MMYNNRYISNPIPLSNAFKAAYHVTKVVPFGMKKTAESSEKILLSSLEDIGIRFYIPISLMKSLNRIIQVSFNQSE